MNKYFNIWPRQTGKTTKAVYEFLKDPQYTLYVAHNMNLANFASKKAKVYRQNFISQNDFRSKIVSRNIKRIVLDEYLFFDDKYEIYENISNRSINELYIFTSAEKQYDYDLFQLIKRKKIDPRVIIPQKYKDEDINDLYYNFITDPDIILNDDFFVSEQNKIRAKHMLSDKQYKLQTLNEYLKKELEIDSIIKNE